MIARFTRRYRPQTNGKAERFNRTLLDEWAYQRPFTTNTERAAALPVCCTPTTTTAATSRDRRIQLRARKSAHPSAQIAAFADAGRIAAR